MKYVYCRIREILEVGLRPGICEQAAVMLNGVATLFTTNLARNDPETTHDL
jgi:hypothetical protein